MALQHGSAFAAKLAFNLPGAAEALNTRSEFPHLYPRQNSSSNATDPNTPTVNLFIDSYGSDFEYAASVVGACSDATTYAIRCTAGPRSIYMSELGVSVTSPCGPTATADTVVVGPSQYKFSQAIQTSVQGVGVALMIAESCALSGTTAAVCAATVSASAQGQSTSTTETVTMTGTDYHRYDVAITGGAEKTANPTACSKGGAAGLNKKAVAVWGLTAALSTVSFSMM